MRKKNDQVELMRVLYALCCIDHVKIKVLLIVSRCVPTHVVAFFLHCTTSCQVENTLKVWMANHPSFGYSSPHSLKNLSNYAHL